MKTILMAVDGSQNATHACKVALGLDLASDDSQLELLGAFELDRGHYLDFSILDPDALAKFREKFRAESIEPVRKTIEELGFYVCQIHMVGGYAPECIADKARERSVDLVVVGRRGLGSGRRFLEGSVSGRLLEISTVPVLVVPQDSPTPKTFKNLVVATDFSEAADKAINLAAEIAKKADARMTYVHCFPKLDLLSGQVRDSGSPDPVTFDQLHQELSAAKKELLETKVKEMVSRGVEADYSFQVNEAVSGILEAAAEKAADLIVLSSHGRSGFQRFWLGNVASRIVKRSKLPVLVVPVGEEE